MAFSSVKWLDMDEDNKYKSEYSYSSPVSFTDQTIELDDGQRGVSSHGHIL